MSTRTSFGHANTTSPPKVASLQARMSVYLFFHKNCPRHYRLPVRLLQYIFQNPMLCCASIPSPSTFQCFSLHNIVSLNLDCPHLTKNANLSKRMRDKVELASLATPLLPDFVINHSGAEVTILASSTSPRPKPLLLKLCGYALLYVPCGFIVILEGHRIPHPVHGTCRINGDKPLCTLRHESGFQW